MSPQVLCAYKRTVQFLKIVIHRKRIKNLIPPIFCPEKCHPSFTSAAYIQVHFRLDLIMEANTINPDQTAPFCLCPYCSQTVQTKSRHAISDQNMHCLQSN